MIKINGPRRRSFVVHALKSTDSPLRLPNVIKKNDIVVFMFEDILSFSSY